MAKEGRVSQILYGHNDLNYIVNYIKNSVMDLPYISKPEQGGPQVSIHNSSFWNIWFMIAHRDTSKRQTMWNGYAF